MVRICLIAALLVSAGCSDPVHMAGSKLRPSSAETAGSTPDARPPPLRDQAFPEPPEIEEDAAVLDLEGLVKAGDEALEQHDYIAAERLATQARIIDRRDPRPLALQARILQKQERILEASGIWARVLKWDPDHPDALYGRALGLLMQDRPQDALPLLEKLNELRPGEAEITSLLGVAQRRVGQAEQAVENFEKTVAEKPTLESYVRLATSLVRENRHQEAIAPLKKAMALAPEDVNLQLQLATSLGLTERLPEAEALLSKTSRLAPDRRDVWQTLATIREQIGDAEGAARAWEGLVKHIEGADPRRKLRDRIERLRTHGLKTKGTR